MDGAAGMEFGIHFRSLEFVVSHWRVSVLHGNNNLSRPILPTHDYSESRRISLAQRAIKPYQRAIICEVNPGPPAPVILNVERYCDIQSGQVRP